MKTPAPLLFRLTNRITLFFVLLLGALVLFYLMGNRQRFLQADMDLILQISAFTGIALTLFLTALIIESIYYFVTIRKLRYIISAVIVFILLTASTLITVLSRLITILAAGFHF